MPNPSLFNPLEQWPHINQGERAKGAFSSQKNIEDMQKVVDEVKDQLVKAATSDEARLAADLFLPSEIRRVGNALNRYYKSKTHVISGRKKYYGRSRYSRSRYSGYRKRYGGYRKFRTYKSKSKYYKYKKYRKY